MKLYIIIIVIIIIVCCSRGHMAEILEIEIGSAGLLASLFMVCVYVCMYVHMCVFCVCVLSVYVCVMCV